MLWGVSVDRRGAIIVNKVMGICLLFVTILWRQLYSQTAAGYHTAACWLATKCKLQSEFPFESFNSNYFENVITVSFWTFLWFIEKLGCFIATERQLRPDGKCIFHLRSYFWLATDLGYDQVFSCNLFVYRALCYVANIVCHLQLAPLLYEQYLRGYPHSL
jgi:hypothetical protein